MATDASIADGLGMCDAVMCEDASPAPSSFGTGVLPPALETGQQGLRQLHRERVGAPWQLVGIYSGGAAAGASNAHRGAWALGAMHGASEASPRGRYPSDNGLVPLPEPLTSTLPAQWLQPTAPAGGPDRCR
jgi:hypothetical protein